MSRMRPLLASVERKFCGLAVPHLTANAGTPAFWSLRLLSEKNFTYTYYDDQNKLSKSGLWVRKRRLVGSEPVWEGKYLMAGDHDNSFFDFLRELPLIAHCVASMTGRYEAASNDFGLKVMAEFAVQRKTWLANEEFKIVLDKMDCGHEVGEVELERWMMPPPRENDVQSYKDHILQDFDGQIQEFMKEYRWAFKTGKHKSKLNAFLERQR